MRFQVPSLNKLRTLTLSSLLTSLLLFTGCFSLPSGMIKPKSPFFSGKPIGPATFSPEGNEIVFSAEEEDGKISHLYRAGVDGTNLVKLTTGTAYNYGPIFTKEGHRLIFSSMSDGKQGDLFSMAVDGSGQKPLTAGPDHDFGPIIGPEGKKVYFIRAQRFGGGSPIAQKSWRSMDIFSINNDGTNLEKITSFNSFRLGNLSLTPDGKTLVAAAKFYKEPYSVWLIPIENPEDKRPIKPVFENQKGKFQIFRTTPKNDELFSPHLSPDGSTLLFEAAGPNGRQQLFTMDMETKQAQRRTLMKNSVYFPQFSMDGSKIIFQTVDLVTVGFFKYREDPTLWIIHDEGAKPTPIQFK